MLMEMGSQRTGHPGSPAPSLTWIKGNQVARLSPEGVGESGGGDTREPVGDWGSFPLGDGGGTGQKEPVSICTPPSGGGRSPH
jgi:hypothetical protein